MDKEREGLKPADIAIALTRMVLYSIAHLAQALQCPAYLLGDSTSGMSSHHDSVFHVSAGQRA